MNIDNVKMFAALTDEKRKHEAEVRHINEQLADLEAVIVNDYLLEGVTTMSVEDHTVYLRETIYISQQLPGHEIAEALKERGLAYLVSVNHQAVRSAIKEVGMDKFDDLFNITVAQKLSVRRKY